MRRTLQTFVVLSLLGISPTIGCVKKTGEQSRARDLFITRSDDKFAFRIIFADKDELGRALVCQCQTSHKRDAVVLSRTCHEKDRPSCVLRPLFEKHLDLALTSLREMTNGAQTDDAWNAALDETRESLVSLEKAMHEEKDPAFRAVFAHSLEAHKSAIEKTEKTLERARAERNAMDALARAARERVRGALALLDSPALQFRMHAHMDGVEILNSPDPVYGAFAKAVLLSMQGALFEKEHGNADENARPLETLMTSGRLRLLLRSGYDLSPENERPVGVLGVNVALPTEEPRIKYYVVRSNDDKRILNEKERKMVVSSVIGSEAQAPDLPENAPACLFTLPDGITGKGLVAQGAYKYAGNPKLTYHAINTFVLEAEDVATRVGELMATCGFVEALDFVKARTITGKVQHMVGGVRIASFRTEGDKTVSFNLGHMRAFFETVEISH